MTSKTTAQNGHSQSDAKKEKPTPRLHKDWLDRHAFNIVKKLKNAGHTTYLVGGCVRDLLLGINPKDYDIGTMARPNQVRKLIRNAFVIGRRFKLVLVKRTVNQQEQQYEVATFRRDPSAEEKDDESQWGDNLFGDPKEDAYRRDFTINALFYDPVDDVLLDEVGGLKDLHEGWIRMIGEPKQRIEEDSIRSLRAIRLKYKINFALETTLRQAIQETAPILEFSALPRRREEYLKFLRTKNPLLPFLDCYDFGLAPYLLPNLQKVLDNPEQNEIFCNYMTNYYHQSIRPNDNIELMSGITFAYFRAAISNDPAEEHTTSSMVKNKNLQEFTKRELGIFNYEQSLILRAIQLQSFLHKREEFERRGERRRSAALNNDAMPLAIKLAKLDYSLSGDDLMFWSLSHQNRDKNVKFEAEEEDSEA